LETSKVKEVSLTPVNIPRLSRVARNMTSVKRIRPINYKQRRKQVEYMKEVLDRKDVQRKFILMNKKILLEKYDDIAQKVYKEIMKEKKQCSEWVTLIKEVKIATKAYRKFCVSFFM